MIKATVLYGHPTDTDAFEKYYAEKHTPIALSMKEVDKMEFTKFLLDPDGGKPAYYRMAELHFTGPAEMKQSIGSPEWQATAADLVNFATGGVTMIIGAVEN